MLVYHYANAHYGLDDLRNTRLKIARIAELNDPFEFLGVDLSDREFRWALKKTKAELSATSGILSFSKTWKNPVLWGHYADKHRGVCLGFEVPSSFIGKVEYVDSRLPRPDVPDEVFMRRLLFTKFEHWQYEQEYRAFVRLEEDIDRLYYFTFSKELTLRRVIVGDQASITRTEVADALDGLGPHVEVFKARAAFTTFDVVRIKDKSMWA